MLLFSDLGFLKTQLFGSNCRIAESEKIRYFHLDRDRLLRKTQHVDEVSKRALKLNSRFLALQLSKIPPGLQPRD